MGKGVTCVHGDSCRRPLPLPTSHLFYIKSTRAHTEPPGPIASTLPATHTRVNQGMMHAHGQALIHMMSYLNGHVQYDRGMITGAFLLLFCTY